MAKADAEVVEDEENMVDVGDEDENAVDVVLEDENENPNIIDQLEAAPDETDETDDKEKDTRTPEQRLQEYLESDEELQNYSKDVQKRIDKLTYQRHEAERREKAATEYAQGVQAENAKLKSKQQHQDGVFINEHKGRLEAQLDTAKRQYKEAYEAADPELIAEANAAMARTASELAQAEQTETRFQRHVQSTPAPDKDFTPYTPDPAADQAPPPVDPKAEAWAEKNEWFGSDEGMTKAALSIHEQLVTADGYLPTGDAYYTELDTRLRKNFPDKFKAPKVQGEQVVAGGNNTPSGSKLRGKKRVSLSPSQVAIAKKLGVPLEEYAKYV